MCVWGELYAVLSQLTVGIQSCATNHNQDTQLCQPPRPPSCYPLVTTPSSPTRNLVSKSINYVISQMLQKESRSIYPFGIGFFSLGIISVRFIPAGAHVDNLFLFIASRISWYGRTTA